MPRATDEVRRAQMKATAILRAQFAAKVALDRIDYYFDVIQPTKRQIEADAIRGQLPEFTVTTPTGLLEAADDSSTDNNS